MFPNMTLVENERKQKLSFPHKMLLFIETQESQRTNIANFHFYLTNCIFLYVSEVFLDSPAPHKPWLQDFKLAKY